MSNAPNMYHHSLGWVPHLAPAHALTAVAVMAAVTAGGVAVRRLRLAYHRT